MKKIRTLATILSLAFGALIGTSSSPAAAATGIKADCTVTQLAYDSHLFVQCSGDPVNYFAYLNDSCSATVASIDTLKIWESMFNSALLSGRKVDIYFSTNNAGCGATARIYNVALK